MRSGEHHGKGAGVVASLLVLALSSTGLVCLADTAAAAAPTSGTLRLQAAALAVRIDTLNTKISILGEEYDQAMGRLTTIRHEISSDKAAIGKAISTVRTDEGRLKHQAVSAYVNAGAESEIAAAISSSGNLLPLQQTYLAMASGSLSTAVSSLRNSEYTLHEKTATLDGAEAQAATTTATIASAQESAVTLKAELDSTLTSINGQLAADVAAQEAAQQAAANRAAAPAAAAAAATSPSVTATTSTAPTTAAASGAGAIAVRAAESQVGVPYVWGGAQPGSGFDCSGLAMWAWSKAGVSLPHSAQAQYDSIEHVSLGALEPGDLVFFASGGYIYHVAMYVGNGQVVQALTYGVPVSISSFPGYAYGAGRP